MQDILLEILDPISLFKNMTGVFYDNVFQQFHVFGESITSAAYCMINCHMSFTKFVITDPEISLCIYCRRHHCFYLISIQSLFSKGSLSVLFLGAFVDVLDVKIKENYLGKWTIDIIKDNDQCMKVLN